MFEHNKYTTRYVLKCHFSLVYFRSVSFIKSTYSYLLIIIINRYQAGKTSAEMAPRGRECHVNKLACNEDFGKCHFT